MNTSLMPKVFVIGSGMVGATAAYTMMLSQIASEIIIIDIMEDLAKGNVMDMNHASISTDGVNVSFGDYSQIEENDIVVITCGIAQKPGQTRLELLNTNAGIVKDVVKKIMANGKNVFILMVTNPVDVLTYVAYKESGLPKERVFGTGTTLDTYRLKYILSQRLNVNHRDISGFILGEHGDSSFPAVSSIIVEGFPLEDHPDFKPEYVSTITADIRDAAYKIIETKKATYHGIAAVINDIVKSIIMNENKIYPVCTILDGQYDLSDVAVGMPSKVSALGAKAFNGYSLSILERGSLKKSASIIKSAIQEIGY